jgi:hypothetical protein
MLNNKVSWSKSIREVASNIGQINYGHSKNTIKVHINDKHIYYLNSHTRFDLYYLGHLPGHHLINLKITTVHLVSCIIL